MKHQFLLPLIIASIAASLAAADTVRPAGAQPRSEGDVGAGEGPAWLRAETSTSPGAIVFPAAIPKESLQFSGSRLVAQMVCCLITTDGWSSASPANAA